MEAEATFNGSQLEAFENASVHQSANVITGRLRCSGVSSNTVSATDLCKALRLGRSGLSQK
jgi:hypothetical protein